MADYFITRENELEKCADGINWDDIYNVRTPKVFFNGKRLILLVTEGIAASLAEDKTIVLFTCKKVNETFFLDTVEKYSRKNVLVAVVTDLKFEENEEDLYEKMLNAIPLEKFAYKRVDISKESKEVVLASIRDLKRILKNRREQAARKKEERADTQQPTEDSSVEEDSSTSVVTSLFDTARNAATEDTQSSSSTTSFFSMSFKERKKYIQECLSLGMEAEDIAEESGWTLQQVNALISRIS